MADVTLTRMRLAEGVWEGLLKARDASVPRLRLRHDDEDLGELQPVEVGEGREQKGRRLARSGLRLSDDIVALEDNGQGQGLDIGAMAEAGFIDRALQTVRQVELVEAGVTQEGIGHGRAEYRIWGGAACNTYAPGNFMA